MTKTLIRAALAVGAAAMSLAAVPAFAEPAKPECIAPAQPGGGFDITCKLAQAALKESGALEAMLRVSYTGVVLSVGSFLLFDHGLDVVLPTGILGDLL